MFGKPHQRFFKKEKMIPRTFGNKKNKSYRTGKSEEIKKIITNLCILERKIVIEIVKKDKKSDITDEMGIKLIYFRNNEIYVKLEPKKHKRVDNE